MSIFKKIKALFTLNGKQQQMDLSAAEVRQDGVFLHPTDEPLRTYFIKADEVDIVIKPGAEITEEDIRILEKKERLLENPPTDEPIFEPPHYNVEVSGRDQLGGEIPIPIIPPESEITPNAIAHTTSTNHQSPPLKDYTTKKKSFTVMLYPDEHEKLTRLIKENGYKKVEYVLACLEAAKKTSMEATYRRLTENRAQRYKQDLAEAKRAREEDMRQQQVKE